jgi:hypothetical protein
MSLYGYRDEFARVAGNASFGEQQTNGLAAGAYTQYFSLTPRQGKASVLGVFVKFVGTATATGAKTPASGTDSLDLFIGGGNITGGGGDIEIAPAAGGTIINQTLTRQFAEFIWVASTNVSVSVAAAPTFASAAASTVTTYVYIPIGKAAAVLRMKLAGAITGVYSTNVTMAYTSVTTYIVSSNYTATAAWKEELTASLGSGLQSVLNYVPQTVSPDAIFMYNESSSTITFASITTIDGQVLCNSADTDVLELAAASFAAISGATYTTTAGFVIAGDQKAFSIFQLQFASATTHYIGYFQIAGGADVAPTATASPTSAPASANQTGQVTASGGVAIQTTAATSTAAPGGTTSRRRA